jgi:hypothetical protein
MMRSLKSFLLLTLVFAGISVPTARAAPWSPPVGVKWQWQLTTPVNTSVVQPVFDIDGFDNSAAVVATLHAQGKRVICYLDMGGAENYRPDYNLYPASVKGKTVGGWPDERWVDIRQIALLQPIITERFDMCRSKGFDAIEPDLADAYANSTGFPITAADQIRWNDHLAAEAHARGMSVALKNAPDIVTAEVPVFDFAIVEECLQYSECPAYVPFVKAGKAVLHTEYKGAFPAMCSKAPAGFSTIKKKLSLNSNLQECP